MCARARLHMSGASGLWRWTTAGCRLQHRLDCYKSPSTAEDPLPFLLLQLQLLYCTSYSLYFVQSVLLLHEGSARTALDLSESQVLASPVPPTPRDQQVLLIGPPANLMQPLDLVGRERSALVRSTKYFVLYSVPKRARETASKGTRALNRALRPSGLEHHPHAN